MDIWQELPKPFLALAPMEGVTDLVFRKVIAKAGAPDLFFTEFTNVSSFASEKGRANALERLELTPTDHPIIAQIWGKNPQHFATLASHLQNLGFSGLDINMGCPDKHVNKAGGGAAMINTPDLAVACIREAKASTNLPISVKTRLGYTKLEEFQTWLPLLLEQKLANLTVHLRTRKEMSKVPAHFELVQDIINLRDQIAPQTKLTINGDIPNKQAALDLAQTYPTIDGYMLGRAVFQNPFCFTTTTPTPAALHQLFLYHLDLFEARQKELIGRGSHYPFPPIKHFIKIYVNHYPGASAIRAELMSTTSIPELRSRYLALTATNPLLK